MKALIFKNRVVQVSQKDFEVHESLKWLDCDDNVTAGYGFVNGEFIAPVEDTPPQWLTDRIAAYADKGWHTEFDLLDDIFSRGFDAVRADRNQIKQEIPKDA